MPEVLQTGAVKSDPSAGLKAGHESTLIEIILSGGLFAAVETRGPLAPAALAAATEALDTRPSLIRSTIDFLPSR